MWYVLEILNKLSTVDSSIDRTQSKARHLRLGMTPVWHWGMKNSFVSWLFLTDSLFTGICSWGQRRRDRLLPTRLGLNFNIGRNNKFNWEPCLFVCFVLVFISTILSRYTVWFNKSCFYTFTLLCFTSYFTSYFTLLFTLYSTPLLSSPLLSSPLLSSPLLSSPLLSSPLLSSPLSSFLFIFIMLMCILTIFLLCLANK